MSSSFLGTMRGIVGITALITNILIWFIPLLPFAVIKLIIPIRQVRIIVDVILNFICTRWADCNRIFIQFLNDTKWDIQGDTNLSMKEWYLVLANHQSWADIVILQFVLNNRIPYFRFFLKQELVWLPIFNFVWAALDYPYMKRYSKAFLEKKPHLKGKDIETTKKSCQKFKDTPVAIMNFVEGTRLTPAKHEKQKSPYKYLLNPRAGGVAFVLTAMGRQLSSILDVTIHYYPKVVGLWGFLCGHVKEVKVRIDHIPVSDKIVGDYFDDPDFKSSFQQWINELWSKKDKTMETLIGKISSDN